MKTERELGKNRSLIGELILFIAQNKKWYLIPVIVVILLTSLLIALASTGAAPFIYTLF